LLEDFQKAIDDAINKGMPLKGWLDKDDTYHPGFLDAFDEIVKKHGWDYKGGRNWRARVIYETNLRTSYSAGRYQQMTDPAVIKAYPFWEYKHAWERVPAEPRQQHEDWDGLVLSADDPWWLTYYPPNDWRCSCGVRPVGRSKLKRMGKIGPDPSPTIQYVEREDPGTGEVIQYPDGVGMGWAYAPGRTWADGLVPREMQKPLKPAGLKLPKPDPVKPDLSTLAKPTTIKPLPTGQSDEVYVSAFLEQFDADLHEPSLWRDKAGHVLVISDDLFKTGDGRWKVKKFGREINMTYLADSLKDPDEIWVDWQQDHAGRVRLVRRYLRYFADLAGFVSFAWSKHGWEGATVFNATKGKANKPDPRYLERQRRGALLYRRDQGKEKE
jgi:hypothetical protein